MDLSKAKFTGYYQRVCLNGHQHDAPIEKLNVNYDYGFCKLCSEKIFILALTVIVSLLVVTTEQLLIMNPYQNIVITVVKLYLGR